MSLKTDVDTKFQTYLHSFVLISTSVVTVPRWSYVSYDLSICLSVCVSFCEQDNSRTHLQVLTKHGRHGHEATL